MCKPTLKRLVLLILCVTALLSGACAALADSPDAAAAVRAAVVDIEKYGHAVLDITAGDFAASGYAHGDVVCVRFESYEFAMPYYDGYYSNPGETMLRGRTPEEQIAVCINYGSFSEETGIAIGDMVEITLDEKAGMLAVQEICALQYSHDRSDYDDDAAFANFRAVTAGRMGEGKLYRTASPVNNKYGRAAYASQLIADAGVATVLNLADAEEDIEEYLAENDFDPAYYRSLYDGGKVSALDLGSNFFTAEFAVSVAAGLTFLARNEPPYCIHCTEGKDRAGFTAMLLEALMGATLEEIVDDYMLSFCNYYGITEELEPQRYQTILDINLFAMLRHVTGAKDNGELAQIDLEAAVTEYLLCAGMEDEDIAALKDKLR